MTLERERAATHSRVGTRASDATKGARRLAAVAGLLDLGGGAVMLAFPGWVLAVTQSAALPPSGIIYVRFVGAFVAAVGASYWLALWGRSGARLRAALEFTIIYRVAAGTFVMAALGAGALPLAWVLVPVVDFALVVAQVILLNRGVGRDY